MFLPSIQISPWSGFSKPMMCFRNTDLPVPEGPSITVILPFGMSQVRSSQTVCDPKVLVSSLTPISTSGLPSLGRREGESARVPLARVPPPRGRPRVPAVARRLGGRAVRAAERTRSGPDPSAAAAVEPVDHGVLLVLPRTAGWGAGRRNLRALVERRLAVDLARRAVRHHRADVHGGEAVLRAGPPDHGDPGGRGHGGGGGR